MFRPAAAAEADGGWQVNGFITLQSGAPFTALNGTDPGAVLLGNPVGTSTRPSLNTNLDLSGLSVRDLQAAVGRALFSPATVNAPIGNAGRNILRANGINRPAFLNEGASEVPPRKIQMGLRYSF